MKDFFLVKFMLKEIKGFFKEWKEQHSNFNFKHTKIILWKKGKKLSSSIIIYWVYIGEENLFKALSSINFKAH